jgi:uncharacterized membrane protein (DUF485 family)
MTQKALQKMNLANAAVAVAFTTAAFAFFPASIGWGVCVGTFLMLGSWYVTVRLMVSILNGGQSKRAVSALFLGLKFVAVLGFAWLAMKYIPIHTLAMGLGIGIMAFSFLITTVIWMRDEVAV